VDITRDVLPSVVEPTLARVLSSTTFRGSPRLRSFLAYVVRHALDGEADRLNQSAIGIDVFERGTRFDPRCDAIVRVEARKLREKLQRYYRTEGTTDPVTISMPPGSYRPVFEVQENPPPTILTDPDGLYAHAMGLLWQSTPESIRRARRSLLAAVDRWPGRADLHVALAETILAELEAELVSPAEGVPALQQAAARAHALDPERTDAAFFAVLAEVRRPNATSVEASARRALAARPRDVRVQYWLASILAAQGRWDEMLSHMGRLVRLQPSSMFFRTWTAVGLFFAGDPKLACRHLREILAVEPQDYLANYFLGQVCALTGRHDESREASSRAYAISGSLQALYGLGFAEASAARVEVANAIIERLERAVARLEAACASERPEAPSLAESEAENLRLRAVARQIAERVDGALARIGRALGEGG